jgi:hypothetical protein
VICPDDIVSCLQERFEAGLSVVFITLPARSFEQRKRADKKPPKYSFRALFSSPLSAAPISPARWML